MAQGVTTKVKNNIVAFALYSNMEFEIATFAYRGGQSYYKLAGTWSAASGGRVLATFDNVYYARPLATQIEKGTIETVLLEGKIVWRNAGNVNISNETLELIKNSLQSRVAKEAQMTLRYTDDELRTVIENGKKLNLPDNEIENIIFNGCRESKAFTAQELVEQTNFWNTVKARGYPNLFKSLQEYEQFGDVIKNLAKEWGLPTNSIYVQGSSLRISDAAKIGDIDIAIRVDAAIFDKLVVRFENATTNLGRKANLVKEATSRGKIGGGQMYMVGDKSFKRILMDKLEQLYGGKIQGRLGVDDLQISIIKEGGTLDVSPYLLIK